MSEPFLERALVILAEHLATENFEKSVSLRVKDVGNIVISGQTAVMSDDRADCAVIATEETFEKILSGALNPMKAAMLGQLKIAGDAKAAMKFGSLFG